MRPKACLSSEIQDSERYLHYYYRLTCFFGYKSLQCMWCKSYTISLTRLTPSHWNLPNTVYDIVCSTTRTQWWRNRPSLLTTPRGDWQAQAKWGGNCNGGPEWTRRTKNWRLYEQGVGHHGIGQRHTEGDRILTCCNCNIMKIMNTYFQHRESHKYTWHGWNGTKQ